MGTTGIWSASYRDNEEYLAELPVVVAPLMQQVQELHTKAMAAPNDSDTHDALRRRLMTVWEMLANIEDIRILSPQATVLRQAAQLVQAAAAQHTDIWLDAEEFVVNVRAEAARVEDWLDTLTPTLNPVVLMKR